MKNTNKLQILKQNILLGMLSFLPLWLTLSLLVFILSFISGQVNPVFDQLAVLLGLSTDGDSAFGDTPVLRTIVAVLLVLAILFLWGWLTRKWIGIKILGFIEETIDQIPVAKPVYRALKGLVSSLKKDEQMARKVVFVDYPHPGVRAVAFLAQTYFEPLLKEEVAAVFIPMGPAPTAGFPHIVSKHLITETDWSVEDALAFIISGGTKVPLLDRSDASPESARDASMVSTSTTGGQEEGE
jgi:uncharacterized membrane protein